MAHLQDCLVITDKVVGSIPINYMKISGWTQSELFARNCVFLQRDICLLTICSHISRICILILCTISKYIPTPPRHKCTWRIAQMSTIYMYIDRCMGTANLSNSPAHPDPNPPPSRSFRMRPQIEVPLYRGLSHYACKSSQLAGKTCQSGLWCLTTGLECRNWEGGGLDRLKYPWSPCGLSDVWPPGVRERGNTRRERMGKVRSRYRHCKMPLDT